MRERPSGRSVAMPALSFQSRALGVTHGAKSIGPLGRGQLDVAFIITFRSVIAVLFAKLPSLSPIRFFIARCASGDLLSGFATGVGQRPHVAEIICGRAMPVSCGRGPSDPLLPSVACAVGQRDPIEPLADVGGVHGRSRDIDRPTGVVFASQISGDSVEPIEASLSRNLLSHDNSGPTGTDEAMKVWPQMPWIISTGSFAGLRERLAGARACPKRSIVGPSCEPCGEAPSAEAGEEMALVESMQIIRLNIGDGSRVDLAAR